MTTAHSGAVNQEHKEQKVEKNKKKSKKSYKKSIKKTVKIKNTRLKMLPFLTRPGPGHLLDYCGITVQ
jgi:hypothetical protein